MQTKNLTTTITVRPKYLWLMMIAYSVAIFSANWFDPRHIDLFGINTGAGSIAFPLTYLLADNITEVYGYKNTRLAIWAGLLFYLIFLCYGQFVVNFLSQNSPNKTALTLFLQVNNRIIIASLASYIVTETCNSYLVAKMKIFFQGKYMGSRFLLATLTAYFFDELIYAPIAFYGSMSTANLIYHMFTSWLFMVGIELLFLPLSVRIAKHIKNIERSDIYDDKTNFNIFNLDTNYAKEDNRYRS